MKIPDYQIGECLLFDASEMSNSPVVLRILQIYDYEYEVELRFPKVIREKPVILMWAKDYLHKTCISLGQNYEAVELLYL